ncbi:hypothetical protein AVEN_131077-1 [Araneus ventricosus]|uniref:Uncharacterized protein n=1 Tax=Araneus ventricosus TaxID=182803 RepID=A0A4Y2D0W2_ARAVE|nr:hypothetical protein AVEN_131077-1 [Araneus ventricosus]
MWVWWCFPQSKNARLRGPRVPGSKPDSTKDPPCMWVWCALNLSRGNVLLLGMMRKLGEGCQLSCHPLRMTAVQNAEVRSKMAVVLLQNGTQN